MKTIGNIRVSTIRLSDIEEMLKRRSFERKTKKRHVYAIEKSMQNSGFMMNSVISVDEDGNLLDGQHRLEALSRLIGNEKIKIFVCEYAKSEITKELLSSFNKSVAQSVKDNLRMNWGWDNNLRLPICNNIFLFVDEIRKIDENEAVIIYESFKKSFMAAESMSDCKKKGLQIGSIIRTAFLLAYEKYGDLVSDKCKEYSEEFSSRCWKSTKSIPRRIYDFMEECRDSAGKIKMRYFGRDGGVRISLARACVPVFAFCEGEKSFMRISSIPEQKLEQMKIEILELISRKYK